MARLEGNYTIEIIVKHSDSDEVLVRSESLNFESAEEDLGKLERYALKVEKEEFIRLEDDENE